MKLMMAAAGTSAAAIVTGASGASADPKAFYTFEAPPQDDAKLEAATIEDVEDLAEIHIVRLFEVASASALDTHQQLQTLAVVKSDSPAADSAARKRFERLAASILREVPFEDGEHHPLEELLVEALEEPSGPEWVLGLWTGYRTGSPGTAATLLRCLGMLPRYQTKDWGHSLMEEALKHDSLRVREAAVMALERWEGKQAIALLQEALPGESVGWLRNYIQTVIADLG